MSTTILSSSSSQQTLTIGADAYLPKGAIIYDSGDHAIENDSSADDNITLVVDGTIIGDNNAIRLISPGGDNFVLVGTSGVVRNIDGGWAAIYLAGDYSVLTNFGEISGGWGAYFEDSEYGSMYNAGSMTALSATSTSAFFAVNSDNFLLTNDGDLVGHTLGNAIEFAASTNVFVTNNSQVIGDIYFAAGTWGSIQNTGVIDGDIEITGTNSSIANTGLITGDVVFSTGNDIFDGFGGLVLGDILGGAGDDIIRSGYGDDVIEGGAGADLINGGLGEDWASYEGSTAGITLDFRTGVGYGVGGDASGDTVLNVENIIGSDYADAIKGDVNANTLRGLNGADDLRGFGGADTLDGGAGADVLFGFADNDILDGGAGADIMVGGDGADVFRFDDGDTGRGADSDIIKDFTADDILDLSAIDAITGGGDDAFTLLSFNGAFSGAGGEARFIGSAGNWTLQYDLDGDQVPDGAIVFQSAYMPTADDIIL